MASEVSWYNIGVSDCRYLSGDWRIAHLHTCVQCAIASECRQEASLVFDAIYLHSYKDELPFTIYCT